MLRPIGLALRATPLLYRGCCKTSKSTVGAVYDRAYFVEFEKKRAVIDRAYRNPSLVNREAIQETGAAGGHQILLAAPAASV